MVEKSGIGFVYAPNFSIGVNMFFEITRLAGAAARHGYSARILERHHIHKKDAPSGTAVTIQKTLQPEAADPHAFKHVAIESIREGDIVGEHTVILESDADIITLQHSAKSRRGFAEGAVVAAEWIAGKRGFYDFSSVWRDLA
jgi:4-hydroxy-tetrahydrodipicolinate reductase